MPKIAAEIAFLSDKALYQTVKPYFYLPGKDEHIDPDDEELNNLEFTTQPNIEVRDMREHSELKLDHCGFEFVPYHATKVQVFNVETDVDFYKTEIDSMLKRRFDAVKVITYELRLRRNEQFRRREVDMNDKLLVEGPAEGAHNDVTWDSGPQMILRHLNEVDQRAFLQPGFRFRIINTWRPLNKVLEDRPLALCDSRTVAADDLIAADRILSAGRVGEVYYLRYNPRQRWYWLEKQKITEPFIFLMYDTMATETSARVCPHVSFNNSRAPPNADIRSSVETRSIVITRAT